VLASSGLATTLECAAELPVVVHGHPHERVDVVAHLALVGPDGRDQAGLAAGGARVGRVFNARRPDRFPAAVLLAAGDDDVVQGVLLAAERRREVCRVGAPPDGRAGRRLRRGRLPGRHRLHPDGRFASYLTSDPAGLNVHG
jgi:hypothetical protein